MSLLEGLNDPQREATKFLSGAALVLAGAGSGKTRVLTHRIAFLLHNGISARHILAVTFTNKAAQEMKERITGLVGDKADKVWISTFHSACLRMLRRDIVVTGISRDFHVFDTDDQLKVMKEIIKRRDLSPQDHPPKRYIAQFDDAKNKGGTDEDCSDYLYDKYGEDAAILFEDYQKSLRRSNALDFNDLIVKLIRLWKEYPDTLYTRQRQFQYVLIDEYQDTNPIQYELIRLLCQTQPQREDYLQRMSSEVSDSNSHTKNMNDINGKSISSQGLGNIMVVGDDDQSIYGFRGADVRNIFRFQEDFSPVHVIRLEQNYRSTGNILKAANSVIRNNASRMEKTMWTKAEDGGLVGLLTSRTMWDEAREVQREIEEIVSGKLEENSLGELFHSSRADRYSYKDIAVIYRTNAYSLPFEQIFRRSATPHVLVGARKFYERSEVKDILAYLKLLINSSDEVSFTRAISNPKRGIGPKTIGQMVVISRRDNIPILEAALQWADGGTSKIKLATLNFCSLILRLRQSLRDGEAVYSLLQDVLQESGYREMLEEGIRKELGEIRGQRNIRVGVGKSDSERQLENINTLVEDITRFVQDFDEEKYIEDSLVEIEAMSESLYKKIDEDLEIKKEIDNDSNHNSDTSVVSGKDQSQAVVQDPENRKNNSAIDNWGDLGPLFSRIQQAVDKTTEGSNEKKPEKLNSEKLKPKTNEEYIREVSTKISSEQSVINLTIIQGLEERTLEKNVLWLRNFLDGTALASSTDNVSSDDQSSVTLMTAHLAKGLEFPIVFVVGMSEGNFPHFRSLENVDDIDEERRLVYVALTRAKKKLYVSYSQTSERWETKSNSKREHSLQPSRFLLEISSSCMERSVSLSRNYNTSERKRARQQKFGIQRSDSIEGRYAKTFSNRQNQLRKNKNTSRSQDGRGNKLPNSIKGNKTSKGSRRKPRMISTNVESIKFTPLEGSYETRTPTSFEDFQETTRVYHEKFGHGVVLQKTGARNNPRLTIEFESWGQRTLLARVANLDLVIPN